MHTLEIRLCVVLTVFVRRWFDDLAFTERLRTGPHRGLHLVIKFRPFLATLLVQLARLLAGLRLTLRTL